MVIFYLFSILFMIMHVYYVININDLDIRFSERDLTKVSKLHLVYYTTRVLYWIWILIGLINDYHYFLWFIVSFSILKFIFYHINNQLYKIWNLLVSPLSISVLLSMFIYWLI